MGKKESLQTTPRLVKEVPEGYKEEMRDGKKVFVKRKETPIPKTPKPVSSTTTNKPKSGTPRKLPPPTPKKVEPELKVEEDVVYMEDIKPDPIPTQKVQRLRTDLKEEFPGGLQKGYHMYKVPDLTKGANYTNAKDVITDNEGMPVVYDFKQGKYVQTGEPNIHLSMPVQNDTPTIQEPLKENQLPTKFDVVPERLRTPSYNTPKVVTPTVDENIYKGFNDIGNTNGTETDMEFQKKQSENLAKPAYITSQPFAKGGIVKKIKGYAAGGTTGYNEFGSVNGVNSGVVGQSDPYAAARQEEADKAEEEKKKRKMSGNQKIGALNTIGGTMNALGGPKETELKYGTNEYFDAKAKEARQGQAVADAVGTIPIIGAFKAVGEGGQNLIAPKDAYGVSKSSDVAIAAGGFLNPLESTTTAVSDIFKGKFNEQTAMNLLAPGVGAVMMNDEKKKQVEQLKKAQLAEIAKANQASVANQAVSAREAGNLNPTYTKPYDLSNVSFDENQNLVLGNNQQYDPNRAFAKGGIVGKIKNMYADGGEIKGKGGPKDDKIKAEVEEGSFVVPAENAELAKGIRKLYLKAPIKKANLKQEGGEEVLLSNKEHLFTPEENEYLESIGVELEALAPNAEEGNKKAEGGPIKGTKVDGATWDGKNWVSENGSKYSAEGGKKFTDKYNQSVAKEKANEEQKKASQINVYSRKLKEATDAGNTEEAKRLQENINKLSGTNKAETKPATTEVKPTTTPIKTGLKAPKVTSKTEAGKFEPTLTPDTGEEVIVPGDKLSPNERAIANADAEKATVQAATLNKSLPQSVATNGTPQNQKRGLADVIGSVDPTSIVGIGQMLTGKKMLSGEVRPVDKAVIDPTYNASVEKALQQATFGFSPEQKFMAQQDIENAKRDSMRMGVNYAGGSGTQAFNLNRAAINDAWKAKLGLSVADQETRMAKQKYADVMAADRANILSANRRQAFNDAMYTFQQKQQAGGELVGAGLQNIIGAYRFNKELQRSDKVNDASNPYKNV